ncbi:AFG1-like ATPase [Aureococcus anophagefferens]|nr:AFG1-like ATPase [Aureococcus anophagefferens]
MAVSARLAARVALGELRPNAAQNLSAVKLDAALERASSWSWLPSGGRGVYLSGSVGSGKTMLLDSLHDEASRRGVRTTLHWHEWIASVHARLHSFRSDGRSTGDKLRRIGDDAAAETRLLCFDELAVHDVADALLLREIFERLFRSGAMVVVTSNRPPRDLYAHGINRHLFVPFIELLEARVDHCDLDALADGAAVDFRRARGGRRAAVRCPGGSAFADACAAVAGGAVAYERRAVAVAHGRRLELDVSTTARCARPSTSSAGGRSARRTSAIADVAAAVHLAAVPRLDVAKHDTARRFIALADVLYDRGVALVVEADAPIDALLDAPRGGAAAARAGDFEVRDEGGSSGKLTTFHADGTEWSATGLIGAAMGAVAGAADTQFAWDRTTSRLFEMTHGAPYRALAGEARRVVCSFC